MIIYRLNPPVNSFIYSFTKHLVSAPLAGLGVGHTEEPASLLQVVHRLQIAKAEFRVSWRLSLHPGLCPVTQTLTVRTPGSCTVMPEAAKGCWPGSFPRQASERGNAN